MLGVCFAAALAACGGAPAKRATIVDLQIEQGKEQILDLSTGQAVTFETMLASLAEARVVYVGERHDNATDHAAQYAVLDGLIARGEPLALGLEMFQRPYQAPLDAWFRDELDEEEMLKRTEYEDRWGFNFDFYRPILDAAKAAGARVIALNAPKEVTRAIAHGGLQALAPPQLGDLPELQLDNKAHRRMVEAELNQSHVMERESLDRYYAAQVVWDETMGQEVAKTMNAAKAPRRMVVLAGRLHVQGGLGIPERAARRGARPWKSVIPVSPGDPLLSWRGAATDRPADYLWVIPDSPPPL